MTHFEDFIFENGYSAGDFIEEQSLIFERLRIFRFWKLLCYIDYLNSGYMVHYSEAS